MYRSPAASRATPSGALTCAAEAGPPSPPKPPVPVLSTTVTMAPLAARTSRTRPLLVSEKKRSPALSTAGSPTG